MAKLTDAQYKRSMDRYSQHIRTVGPTEWRGNGSFQHPWYVRNVLCEDGRRRTAYLGPDADTFFSWPARVKVNHVWVKGFVTTTEVYDYPGLPSTEDTLFMANSQD